MAAEDVSYLDTDVLADMLESLPGLDALRDADANDQYAACIAASERIDASDRWQGRKYDSQQVREFPRVARGSANVWGGSIASGGEEIWDLDGDGAVIVPRTVKLATLHEANAILDSSGREERLQAIADGVVSQSNSGMSESYGQTSARPGGRSNLCLEAAQFMAKYKLTSGQMI